jgi:hypothetical protein
MKVRPKLTIQTDGTISGTRILLDGKEMDGVTDIRLEIGVRKGVKVKVRELRDGQPYWSRLFEDKE